MTHYKTIKCYVQVFLTVSNVRIKVTQIGKDLQGKVELSQHSLSGTKENYENLVTAKIQTKHLPNTNRKVTTVPMYQATHPRRQVMFIVTTKRTQSPTLQFLTYFP